MSPGKQRLKHLRTRTVDDDLAECNLTRRDLAQGAYSFRNVWSELRRRGWFAKTGGALSYDHFYIKPGKNTTDEFVENVDYFYGEAAIVQYAIDVQLFGEFYREDEHDEGDSASADAVSAPTPRNPSSSQATMASASHTDTDANSPASSARRQSTGSSASSSGRTNAKARRKSVPAPTRTWPNTHPSKGRHVNDAISLDSSEDDTAEEITSTRGAGSRQTSVPPSPQREPEEPPAPYEHSGSADDGDTASSADGSSSASGRPLLKTKRTFGVSRPRYTPTPMMAKKVKSAPRGLLFERHPEAVLGVTEPKVEVSETETKFDPASIRSRCFGGAPAATPSSAAAATASLPRRRSRASTPRSSRSPSPATTSSLPPRSTRNPSSLRSRSPSPAPSNASHETHTTSATDSATSSSSSSAATAATTHLDVGDVMFPSSNSAMYRVTIVGEGSDDERKLTITVEDTISKEQW
ncbi:hypothetical protein PINS_up007697 [Pythium insidiosum]|nr:hypothetical protein PINS_up007697 [Pythium insidiosum]